MSKFLFKIGENIFQINNLTEFMSPQFLSASFDFFDQKENNYNAHNEFFENFGHIWELLLNKRSFKDAEYLWHLALSVAYQWEEKNPNKRIHKGTPYYFWGVTCILNSDLEKGFLLMHQALEEDKETFNILNPQKPAYFFVTLDDEKQNQYFRKKVLEIAKFLDGKLNNYCSSRGGTLNLAALQSKFLKDVTLQEVAFYFVFELFRLKKLLLDIDQKLTKNIFSSLLQANTIFSLCLIVDNVLKKKNPTQWKFYDHLEFLSNNSSLNLDGQKLRKLGNAFNNDFSNTLQSLLSSQYHFQDSTIPQSIEEDFAITYGFRNFGAHKIEDQPIIYENFKEITERILNALFFSIEKLY